MGGEDPVIQRFRALLNEFKRPYIERVSTQSTGDMEGIFSNIDSLYFTMKPIIEQGGSIPQNADKAVVVFEKQGVLPALRNNPSLKPALLRYLTLDLHTYPYTLNPTHISKLAEANVESHQGEIVSNELTE